MSKTVADVKSALADLDKSTSAALADIGTEVDGLKAQITALQGEVSPDFTDVLATIAGIKAKIVAADPGDGSVPSDPAAPSA